MLKEVTKFEWNEIVKNQVVSIFNDSEYLELISRVHKTELKFWVIYNQRNKPIIGFATHIRRRSIIVPDHFGYSSFWKDTNLGGFSFFDYLDKALNDLKKMFNLIEFRLPPDIMDIRAFNHNGFTCSTNFTYLNQTAEAGNYRNDILKKLKSSYKESFTFLYNENYEEVLRQQLNDFKYFGYSKSKIDFYRTYFQKLIDYDIMKSFCVYKNNELIASALVIIDFDIKMAYNILLSSSKTYSSGVSVFLYDNMMRELNQRDVVMCDFYGADMKGIANFKSGFNGELVTHFTVIYSLVNSLKENLFIGLKRMLNFIFK